MTADLRSMQKFKISFRYRQIEQITDSQLPTLSSAESSSSSLSDLIEIGCKLNVAVWISPLCWAIEQLLPCKIVKWGKQVILFG